MATPLTTIEGIGPAIAEKLATADIDSVETLLDKCKTPKSREVIAKVTGVDAKRLLRFTNHADLMRVKGIGGEYAELLEAAGVDTVPELARRNAENLYAALSAANAEKKLVRQLASPSQVAGWVEQAGSLDRMVEY